MAESEERVSCPHICGCKLGRKSRFITKTIMGKVVKIATFTNNRNRDHLARHLNTKNLHPNCDCSHISYIPTSSQQQSVKSAPSSSSSYNDNKTQQQQQLDQQLRDQHHQQQLAVLNNQLAQALSEQKRLGQLNEVLDNKCSMVKQLLNHFL
jgi:cell division protein FtsN